MEKVYWTSRRKAFFSREVESGWIYKLKNKESKIYETRLEAENLFTDLGHTLHDMDVSNESTNKELANV